MKYFPVIVVVAFNRPKSLERLLFSIKNAQYTTEVKLIISIDNDDLKNLNVKKIADDFIWPFGEKEVKYQQHRLGLKKHVIQCGDLCRQYESIIMLEDDLFVSKYFYEYSLKALEYYDLDENIGGISLYNYPYEDLINIPFVPIRDESDVYFIQFPSSLGQAWTAKHWNNFRKWLDQEPDLLKIPISEQVYNWPATSWKKLFGAFLVDLNKYFVFPFESLTTNFNDCGTHLSLEINHNGQIPLKAFESTFRFKSFSASLCKYDAHFELKAETVKHFNPDLTHYDFEMDLYGHKRISRIKSPYIITSRLVKNSIMGFSLALKPHEMNVLLGYKGNELNMCRKEDIVLIKSINEMDLFQYRYYVDSYSIPLKLFLYSRFKKNRILSKVLQLIYKLR